MKSGFTRRRFLGSAGALGAATLLPSKAALASTPLRSEQAPPQAAPTSPPATSFTSIRSQGQVEGRAVRHARCPPAARLWKDTMELNRSYLYSLPNERLAHNFRVTAGIPSDADPLGGWEAPDCELRGHYVGHYLSSCALMHASTGDEPIRRQSQRSGRRCSPSARPKDGYLGAYPADFLRPPAQA